MPERLTKDQLHQLLAYARSIKDTRLSAVCLRAIDGDSAYHSSLMERCSAAYAGAHNSDEFKRASKPEATGRRRRLSGPERAREWLEVRGIDPDDDDDVAETSSEQPRKRARTAKAKVAVRGYIRHQRAPYRRWS